MLHIVVMSYFIDRAKGLVSNIIVVLYYNTVVMCCDVACSTPSVLVARDFGIAFPLNTYPELARGHCGSASVLLASQAISAIRVNQQQSAIAFATSFVLIVRQSLPTAQYPAYIFASLTVHRASQKSPHNVFTKQISLQSTNNTVHLRSPGLEKLYITDISHAPYEPQIKTRHNTQTMNYKLKSWQEQEHTSSNPSAPHRSLPTPPKHTNLIPQHRIAPSTSTL
jgi:hypothetical protein